MNIETEKIAIFIDVENLTKWIKDNGPEKLLDEITNIGHPIVRRAYGNWTSSSVTNFQSSLNRLGFELIHNYHPISGKNSSDIQMTVDVIEYAWNLKDISWFILATGDSDFSPLFRRLREMGKNVIGVGPRSTLSETVKTSCSRYIYTDSKSKDDEIIIQSAYEDAVDNVERVMKSFGEPIHLPMLKSKLLNIDSAFNEKQLGYKSFSLFLKSIDDIDIKKNLCIFSKSKQKIKKINNSDSTTDITQEYKSILRRKNWRILPKSFLILIFKTMINLPPLPKDRIVNETINSIGNITTPTDVRKAYSIFIRCQLFTRTTSDSRNEENLFVIKNKSMSHIEMLIIRDISITSRIVHGTSELGIPLNKEALKPLLYSPNNKTDIESIIFEAKSIIKEINL